MRELTEVYQEVWDLGEAIKERLATPLRPEAVDAVMELVDARGRLLAGAEARAGTDGDPIAPVEGLQALMQQQQVLEGLIELALTDLQSELQEAGRSRMQLSQTGSTIRLRGPSRHLDTRR